MNSLLAELSRVSQEEYNVHVSSARFCDRGVTFEVTVAESDGAPPANDDDGWVLHYLRLCGRT